MFEENWDGFGSEDEKTSPKTEEERVAAPAAKKRRRDDDTSVEGKNEGKKEEEEQQEKEEEEWTVNGLTREQEHAALVRVAAALAASASGATVAYTGDAERRFVAAVLRCCRSVAAEDEPTRSRIAVAARSDADTADRGAPLAVRVQGVLDAAARTHERAHDTFRRVTALLAATPVRALAAAAPALARVRCVLCEDGAWRPLAACLYCDDDACAALWERVQASTSTTTSESGAALFGRSAWALGGLQRHRCAALWRHAGARFVSDLFERRVGDRRDAADDYDLMAFLRLHSDRIQQHVRATRRATYDLLAATGVAARLCNLRIVRCTSFRVHEVFRGTNNSTSTSVGERAFEVEGAVAALCRERDGDVLCYASTLPAPLVPAAVLLEATKALSATARHASQRVWRVLVALAASRDRADACRRAHGTLPPHEPRWALCDTHVRGVGSVTALEPVAALDTAAAFLGAGGAAACARAGWDVCVYNGMFQRPGATHLAPDAALDADAAVVEGIGRAGEEAAHAFLCRQYAAVPGARVVWASEETEGGFPYDLFVTLADGTTHYYEVKATAVCVASLSSLVHSHSLAVCIGSSLMDIGVLCCLREKMQSSSLVSFPITAREWDFARKHGQTYHILRVMRVGRPDMTVVKLTNPHRLALQGNVKLYLALDKSPRQR